MAAKKIFLAIPLMDEWENLLSLIEDINHQSIKNFHVVFCVNQPDNWWKDIDKQEICRNNEKCLHYLSSFHDFPISLIDRSSPGKGWTGKEYGVGWARKTIMDYCAAMADPLDIIISLDGDTRFGPDYLESIRINLNEHPKAVALSVPYYHRLTGKDAEDFAILRYEIYMRYYVLNLWKINSPYSFTALGSAMAFTVKSYRAIRGMTPNKSGEDFYFLQKLRKYGKILYWNPEKVYPQARFSDRVFFGTGPAMMKGRDGDWSSYPLYSPVHFKQVQQTCELFPELFHHSVETPMDSFLKCIFGEDDPWKPIRANHPQKEKFIRACHEKIDGLRILQYLKTSNVWGNARDEAHLKQFLDRFVDKDVVPDFLTKDEFSFKQCSKDELNTLRDLLAQQEEKFQKNHYQEFNT